MKYKDIEKDIIEGKNQKVKELKQFKEDFNK